MWKRFIKTRCSVISYYWHKSSLVLSFSVSSILQDVFIESGQNPFKYAQNRPKFDIPFSVFPAFQYLAIFICGSVYYKLSLILIPRKASLMRQYPSSRCVLGLNLCGDKEHEK